MALRTRLDFGLQLIRSEFQEVPELRVTIEQAAVLWNLETRDLELILETFVDVGFLRRASDGSYFHPQPRGVAADPARPSQAADRLRQRTPPARRSDVGRCTPVEPTR
jgi:hypothetical protein